MALVILIEALIAAGLLGLLLAAQEAAFRVGRRKHREDHSQGQLQTVQGAMLGLMGLMLGFAFGGAMSRFTDRQDLVVREANAIGTAYLRADVLPAAQRQVVKASLRRYAEDRLRLFDALDPAEADAIHRRLTAEQETMWKSACAGIADHAALAQVVLPALNDVIDALSVRDSAVRRHLPVPVMTMLIACACFAMMSVGYGQGRAGRVRGLGTTAFAILIAAALWITLDLDYPRRGLIKVAAGPLMELKQSMRD